jgi:hypothetical protein
LPASNAAPEPAGRGKKIFGTPTALQQVECVRQTRRFVDIRRDSAPASTRSKQPIACLEIANVLRV